MRIQKSLLISWALVLLSLTKQVIHAFTAAGPSCLRQRRAAYYHVLVQPNNNNNDNLPNTPQQRRQHVTSARSYSTTTELSALPDIGSMKVGDIRQELESYGISTRSFLEKKEFIKALEQARAEGKTPINNGKTQNRAKATSTEPGTNRNDGKSASDSKSSSSSSKSDETASRSDRLRQELEKANAMKVGDLKKQLNAMGVSTKSFFEKSEFVKAYADAMVNGPPRNGAKQDEPFDPSYRDVVMQKFDNTQQRMLSGTVIDIKLK